MVVAAGSEERRRGQLRLFFHAERVAVERGGAGDVGDLQMHVPDERVGGDSAGGSSSDCASRSSRLSGSVTMFTP